MTIAGTLFNLQIAKGDYYYRLSERNRIRIVPKRAPRGRIIDRKGKILVDNRPTYTISILPFEFKPKPEVMSRLERLLGTTSEDILKRLERGGVTPYSPVPVMRRVDFETVSELQENLLDYPGVIYEVEPQRVYPWKSHAAHAIGYVGEISAPELRELYREGYKAGDFLGKLGIERSYDTFLRGRDGAEFLEVRVTGEVVGPVEGRSSIPLVPGADIVSTLDLELQAYAETLMTNVHRGVFIAMDPNNGEIIAMVSRPSFDLDLFTATISDSLWELLNCQESHPLLNRAIQGTYPPASVYKMVTAMGAVDEGIANEHTMLEPCEGSMWFGDRWFGCWTRHGRLNLLDAIAQSCDVYFYQLGLHLGLDKWSELSSKSGFGKQTGIDIGPEAAGFVPTREYFLEKYGRRGWGTGVILNLCIGQGEILVTPLQIAQYISAIANGGNIYKPKLVKEIRPQMGRPLVVETETSGRLPASTLAIRASQEGMSRTVNSPMGTAAWTHLPDIKFAGKTGTAQNPHGATHAWFVGYAPTESPRLTAVLLVEHGGSGGAWAGAVRDFFWYYFNIYEPRLS